MGKGLSASLSTSLRDAVVNPTGNLSLNPYRASSKFDGLRESRKFVHHRFAHPGAVDDLRESQE